MTGTNHGLTGAMIAVLVKEPAVAIPLSFVSHFACDAIPHYGLAKDEELLGNKFNLILIVDFILAVSLMAVFGIRFPSQKWIIWGCMASAASPDLAWAYYHLYLEKLKKRTAKLDILSNFHHWIQWSQTPNGKFVEIFWFLSMGAIILSQR